MGCSPATAPSLGQGAGRILPSSLGSYGVGAEGTRRTFGWVGNVHGLVELVPPKSLVPTNAAGIVYLGVASQPGRMVAVGSSGVISYSGIGYEPLISTNTYTNAAGAAVRVVLTNLTSSPTRRRRRQETLASIRTYHGPRAFPARLK